MLKLRRGIVAQAPPSDGPEQELIVELKDGARRAAIADVALHGRSEVGDEVIVNVQARDLELGSGGFDIVHVNLTRGLHGEGLVGAHVMKLNYTSLQHAVRPVEDGEACEHSNRPVEDGRLRLALQRPVGVLALHGQLAPVAWAFAQARPGGALGFVQTPGGALSGGRSRTVRELRERGLLAGHLTAGTAYGGEGEAMSTAGALHHGLCVLGWDAAVCGPGPGIVGSGSPLGHGGISALESAHTALALGAPTLLVARMSSGDPRQRHRGISHHTLTVLELLLGQVSVALPVGECALNVATPALQGAPSATFDLNPLSALDLEPPSTLSRHDWRRANADLHGYERSGLPDETMGRTIAEDPLFFAAALAGGTVLSELR